MLPVDPPISKLGGSSPYQPKFGVNSIRFAQIIDWL